MRTAAVTEPRFDIASDFNRQYVNTSSSDQGLLRHITRRFFHSNRISHGLLYWSPWLSRQQFSQHRSMSKVGHAYSALVLHCAGYALMMHWWCCYILKEFRSTWRVSDSRRRCSKKVNGKLLVGQEISSKIVKESYHVLFLLLNSTHNSTADCDIPSWGVGER